MAKYFMTSKRLGFRRWDEDDLGLAMKLWGDPEVTRFISKKKFTKEQVKERLDRQISSKVQYWPIFLLKTGEFVGCCGLRPYKQIYELGFHICSKHWRKGYAFEAASCVIEYAFRKLKAKALFSGHNPKNKASEHLLKKLGFRYTHDEYYEGTGEMHPSYLMER